LSRLDLPTFDRPRKATSGTGAEEPKVMVRNLAADQRSFGAWARKKESA
jgi:hypothetical protein